MANRANLANPGCDLITERFVDCLVSSRNYFDARGRLLVERLVADALLLRRLVYPDGVESEGTGSVADFPAKGLNRRAAQANVGLDKN
jgi:hypothetical protein